MSLELHDITSCEESSGTPTPPTTTTTSHVSVTLYAQEIIALFRSRRESSYFRKKTKRVSPFSSHLKIHIFCLFYLCVYVCCGCIITLVMSLYACIPPRLDHPCALCPPVHSNPQRLKS